MVIRLKLVADPLPYEARVNSPARNVLKETLTVPVRLKAPVIAKVFPRV